MPNEEHDWLKDLEKMDANTMYKNLMVIMKGGGVKRYHAETLIGPLQKVSEHSWGVTILVNMLWPNASKKLILAAIYHDTHEGEVGDIPAPTKKILSGTTSILKDMEKNFHEQTDTAYESSLTDIEKTQLKIADYLELVLFCQHQYKMGNEHIEDIGLYGIDQVKNIFECNPKIMTQEACILTTTILCS